MFNGRSAHLKRHFKVYLKNLKISLVLLKARIIYRVEHFSLRLEHPEAGSNTKPVGTQYKFHNLDDLENQYKHFLSFVNNKRQRHSLIKIKMNNIIGKKLFPLSTTFSYPKKFSKLLESKSISQINENNSSAVLLFNDSAWEHNYYHWHIDFLLSVVKIKEIFPIELVTVFLQEHPREFQKDSLRMLGINENQIKYLNCDGSFRKNLPEYIILDQNRLKSRFPFDFVHPLEVNALAKIIKAKRIFGKRTRRVILSRSDAKTRRILNEQELFKNILKPLGFEIVILSELSFNDQVALFAESEMIIAAHGAGLTNVIYSSDCSVLELFSREHGVRPDYMQLTNAVGSSYYCYTDPEIRPDSDIYIPEKVVRNFLMSASLS